MERKNLNTPMPKSLLRSLTDREQEVRKQTLEGCLEMAQALDPHSPICQAIRDLLFMEKRIQSAISGKTISGDSI